MQETESNISMNDALDGHECNKVGHSTFYTPLNHELSPTEKQDSMKADNSSDNDDDTSSK